MQARDINGDVYVGRRPARPRWWWVIGGLVVLLAGTGAVLVLQPSGPAELRVTADLSANDTEPWGYASADPGFPGPELAARLARPGAAMDSELAHDVRVSGGASLLHQVIRLHLEGPRTGQVVVTDIRAVIRKRLPPLSGALVWSPPQGAEDSAQTLLELDDRFPVLQSAVRDATGNRNFPAGPYFPAHTIPLPAGGTSEVIVTASAAKGAYDFDLAVFSQSGKEIKQTTVDDAGKPFRVSGFPCSGPGQASYRTLYFAQADTTVSREPDPEHFDGVSEC
ncbi:hypothetical protein [Amycolatopsis sp. CA-128772]|uniref:hypothetical protein n=1 Tax=Amycolatopsis sp. CA-128772 TaxID=2073159 RepID=UPI000CD13E2F|nr:hypothetical protein [Amycolatopsis sp. CA-128772]